MTEWRIQEAVPLKKGFQTANFTRLTGMSQEATATETPEQKTRINNTDFNSLTWIIPEYASGFRGKRAAHAIKENEVTGIIGKNFVMHRVF